MTLRKRLKAVASAILGRDGDTVYETKTVRFHLPERGQYVYLMVTRFNGEDHILGDMGYKGEYFQFSLMSRNKNLRFGDVDPYSIANDHPFKGEGRHPAFVHTPMMDLMYALDTGSVAWDAIADGDHLAPEDVSALTGTDPSEYRPDDPKPHGAAVVTDGGVQETARTCSECGNTVPFTEERRSAAFLAHYVEDHPDSETLKSVLDGVQVRVACVGCGSPFPSSVDVDRQENTFMVTPYCPACVGDAPFLAMYAAPTDAESLMASELDKSKDPEPLEIPNTGMFPEPNGEETALRRGEVGTNKLYTAIRSFTRRFRLAARVFREGPDELISLTETPDGDVEFRHRFGVGIASNHVMALEGARQVYAFATGQVGPFRDRDGSGGEDDE